MLYTFMKAKHYVIAFCKQKVTRRERCLRELFVTRRFWGIGGYVGARRRHIRAHAISPKCGDVNQKQHI